MYEFVQTPQAEDYFSLALHLAEAHQEKLHTSLWPLRDQVVDRLRQMATEPAHENHRAAYEALRLFLW